MIDLLGRVIGAAVVSATDGLRVVIGLLRWLLWLLILWRRLVSRVVFYRLLVDRPNLAVLILLRRFVLGLLVVVAIVIAVFILSALGGLLLRLLIYGRRLRAERLRLLQVRHVGLFILIVVIWLLLLLIVVLVLLVSLLLLVVIVVFVLLLLLLLRVLVRK